MIGILPWVDKPLALGMPPVAERFSSDGIIAIYRGSGVTHVASKAIDALTAALDNTISPDGSSKSESVTVSKILEDCNLVRQAVRYDEELFVNAWSKVVKQAFEIGFYHERIQSTMNELGYHDCDYRLTSALGSGTLAHLLHRWPEEVFGYQAYTLAVNVAALTKCIGKILGKHLIIDVVSKRESALLSLSRFETTLPKIQVNNLELQTTHTLDHYSSYRNFHHQHPNFLATGVLNFDEPTIAHSMMNMMETEEFAYDDQMVMMTDPPDTQTNAVILATETPDSRAGESPWSERDEVPPPYALSPSSLLQSCTLYSSLNMWPKEDMEKLVS